MTMGEQITQIVNNIADLTKTSKNMEEAENASQDTMIELSDAVQRTTDAVARIAKQIETTNESVDKIGNAASLIADIASQTSLLSLNASIESARARRSGEKDLQLLHQRFRSFHHNLTAQQVRFRRLLQISRMIRKKHLRL